MALVDQSQSHTPVAKALTRPSHVPLLIPHDRLGPLTVEVVEPVKLRPRYPSELISLSHVVKSRDVAFSDLSLRSVRPVPEALLPYQTISLLGVCLRSSQSYMRSMAA
jgi:hypothetical protein